MGEIVRFNPAITFIGQKELPPLYKTKNKIHLRRLDYENQNNPNGDCHTFGSE